MFSGVYNETAWLREPFVYPPKEIEPVMGRPGARDQMTALVQFERCAAYPPSRMILNSMSATQITPGTYSTLLLS